MQCIYTSESRFCEILRENAYSTLKINSQVAGFFGSEFLVIYVAAKAPLVKSGLQPLFLAAAMVVPGTLTS